MIGIWDQLAQKRICFGHQSVGADVMTALSMLNGERLSIVEGRDPETFQRPVFAHFRVGQNRDPLSKYRDFATVINSGVGERVDIAFFKMCYVDVTAQTDVKKLFADYQDMMSSLGKSYPKVMFLHVTVPLRRVGGGMLGWLREKTRGFDCEREDQVQRHAFNQLLRGAYGRSGRFFDLAEQEVTFQDGKPSYFQYRGETVPNLVSGYTDDGGHLNQLAAERIAGRLLACLSAAG
ncbi:MAG: hypothetical protein HP496_17925 [Nitrospira sp.]|nr:hypothetical protein [Nitrospira sp.]